MAMGGFSPRDYASFVFHDWSFAQETGELTLRYALDDQLHFAEHVVFPPPFKVFDEAALSRCFDLVHWLAGVSYYKTALPRRLHLTGPPPGRETARLLETTWREGLGEMLFRGGFSLPAEPLFPISPPETNALMSAPPAGVVVPLGGGKDSLVTCSVLAEAEQAFRTIAVGQSPLIRDLAPHVEGSAGHVRIERYLDPQLADLNARGACNGHVPISAILAAIMLAGGYLYGYDTVVMSNERSADAANLALEDGTEVNHQFSKSGAFEVLFNQAVNLELVEGFRYFSLLRGVSEIGIARHFAQLAPYFSRFSSCNRNFRQDRTDGSPLWCGNCPKCRFVYLALAPFQEPQTVDRIFGKNMLQDVTQIDGYRELAGISGHKPFECVGEVEESRALLHALADDPRYQKTAVVHALAAAVADADPLAAFLEAHPVDLPDPFPRALQAL